MHTRKSEIQDKNPRARRNFIIAIGFCLMVSTILTKRIHLTGSPTNETLSPHLLLTKPQPLFSPSPTPFPSSVLRLGTQGDTRLRTIILTGCGAHLPKFAVEVKLPANWTVTERRTAFDAGSSYFEAEGNDQSFQMECTTDGVGDDLCDESDRKTFTVAGLSGTACYGFIAGKWSMGVLNLPRNPITDSVVAFWATGVDPTLLKNIFSTVKIIATP